MDTLEIMGIEERVLVYCVVMGETLESACSCCYGACVGGFVEGAEVREGCCPGVGRVYEGWGYVEWHFGRAREDGRTDGWCAVEAEKMGWW